MWSWFLSIAFQSCLHFEMRTFLRNLDPKEPFENVKGLWRTAKHRAFYNELKQILEDSGYLLTDRLTNSLEYGVPQDRDRILLVFTEITTHSEVRWHHNPDCGRRLKVLFFS